MIEIRSCEGFAELEACVQLQIATWGYDASDVVPRKAFLVVQKSGGQVLGAFDREIAASAEGGDAHRLVGFAFALAGVKSVPGAAPMAYLHSHMLAVRPEYRNQGLGARLKQAQRVEALGRGIRHMEWTFDPLEIKNAYLNICKLGAIVRRYKPNFYGSSTSHLQAGLPTDRLVAEWAMDSERVEAALVGQPLPAFGVVERITVPAAIYVWKAAEAERSKALAVQTENRMRFEQAFGRGLAVLGFEREAAGNGSYLLGQPSAELLSLFPKNS
ncbi:GNAT family N-acetyltransferase [Telmatobacter bradus]|uniref:GNAT family N-acetyltransferase n=1 Tax=Telmatobacter bradus TaxID=474953 RepID=UPI003B4324CF